MLDREPFLQAIYAAPDDDLPRLVFADYLDEQGDSDWAELIRAECSFAQGQSWEQADRVRVLREALGGRMEQIEMSHRGFPLVPTIGVHADVLADADAFRLRAVTACPHWYGATTIEVMAGVIITPEPLGTILASPVTANVRSLILAGIEVETTPLEIDEFVLSLSDFETRPVITGSMVEALCRMRECRRLSELDLRNNDLGNDALRALAKSPHLIRLERLRLTSPGTRFRGRVWQQVHDRFGPEVLE